MATNPNKFLTNKASTDIRRFGTENESGYINKTSWKKGNNKYRQIHRAIRQRISVGSHVTAIRATVWSSGKLERLTLLVQSALTQMYILTLPHRRQTITLTCTHDATTHKTEPLRDAAWWLLPLIPIRRNSVPISAGVTTILTQIFVDPLRNLKYPIIHRVFTSDHLSFNPSNAELNPICHLLALLGAHHILQVSRIRVNNDYLTL
jgi:hypothetical protein